MNRARPILIALLLLVPACGAAPATTAESGSGDEAAEMRMDEGESHDMDDMDMEGVGTTLGTLSESSAGGLFVVSATSEHEAVTLNEMHSWTLHIEDAAGNPVEGATIAIGGGMPAHGHGLPTEPQVTEELGGGDYRLEGVRFNMAGEWELTLAIEAAEGSDEATLRFELQ